MLKKIILVMSLCAVILAGCVQYDESTYITDDYGVVHHTTYYTLDKRGRSYYPMHIKPPGEKLFVFDPKAAAWAAYDAEGNRVMTGAASGGKDICEDVGKPCRTVTGTFRVYNKRGADCKSGEYPVETEGGAKMPYCMYFFQGFTIHAGYEVPNYNASHGCVRVLPSAAKWLNEQFITIGTRVIILSYEDENGDGDWLQAQANNTLKVS
ncbi:MAG TPA: L,D-transpeptidase [Legionellaceae bacterium]|nr:L,D-transpeptidase [Legionellaceae bacterium]